MEENTSLDSLTAMETLSSNQAVPIGWGIMMCVTLLLVGFLIGRKSEQSLKRRSHLSKERKKAKEHEVDYDNVINSAFEARKFAKTLKTRCHPDLFADDEIKMQIAEALHQEVEEKSRNLKELQAIEQEIFRKLYS